MKTLKDVQREVGIWARSQFADNVSKDDSSVSCGARLGSLPSLLGMVEEIGELCHAVIYRHQGRGYADVAEHKAAKADALADLLVFACDFAEREGICLEESLNLVWEKVRRRNQKSWGADKAAERA